MDDPRFDALVTRLAGGLSRRRGLGLLAGAGLPLVGLAGTADAGKKKKVTLCRNGQTVSVPKKKARKLLQQGATKGACPAGCPAGQRPCNTACIPTGDCCFSNDCPGNDFCVGGTCVSRRCGSGGPCVVFQSQGVLGTALNGLAGADQFCTTSAAAVPALAGRPFKAWLSAGNQTPLTRFTNTAFAGPYVLVGNASDNGGPPPTVADSFADLITCEGGAPQQCLKAPILRRENGSDLAVSAFVWTGTNADGSGAANTCDDWKDGPINQGQVGETAKTTSEWTNSASQRCSSTVNSVYCFEQPT